MDQIYLNGSRVPKWAYVIKNVLSDLEGLEKCLSDVG